MRVAFVSNGNPYDRRNWAGTPHYALREMSRRIPDLHVVDTNYIDTAILALNRLTRRFGWDVAREPFITWLYSKLIGKKLKAISPDIVLSIGASNKLASLKPRWPIVHISDALFETITTYYSKYNNISKRSRILGNNVQQKLIDLCYSIFLSSDWARDSALNFYRAAPDLIKVLPLGANIDRDPGREFICRDKTVLNIAFVGIAWKRKGGPFLIEVFREIYKLNSDARLHIAGCYPAEAQGVPGVLVYGYLNKSDPEQKELLEQIYEDASVFAMLSLEEAFGLVYCEAAAYGLPSIALRTGGIPTIVRDGETGLLFDPTESPQSIATRVVELWTNQAEYDRMRMSARHEFETRLNWTSWGDAVERELRAATLGAVDT